tara:strand:+ start:53 stop:784 length:732 start_codon:yes stop_codon:yes gene_type:complete
MDFYFYLFASFGVIVFGLSKGGFPGPISMLAVPVMSFAMSPLKAAGILLPLLLVMDVIAIYLYWNKWNIKLLKIIVPSSILGIAIGTFTFQYTSENQIRILVGAISILFVILSLYQKNSLLLNPTKTKGIFWSGAAGYTSFLIHAGNPPINFYVLPLKLDKMTYIGTMTMTFFIINIVKIVPYYYLDLLAPSNLKISLLLFPLAIISVIFGFYIQKFISEKIFFNIIYFLLFLSGLKLIFDAI